MASWQGVLRKDLRIEFRTRYGVSAVVMFLLITVAVILYSTPGEQLQPSIISALLWIALFFGAMTGLARSFVSEEERGTALLLRLYASGDSVMIGKLIYNLGLMLMLAVSAVVFFLFFFARDFNVRDWGIFWLQLVLGAAGVAAVSTILSALISRASQKGALLPILALPVLMPLVIATTDATRIAIEVPNAWVGARGDILILLSFDVAMMLVSYVLFDVIWKD
ncbi:MAG: heme exporter protein CcmB [Bacteroidota bacterium]|nr:heme exporter protein CcmB [Bacteroidota bacterium]MDP4234074.1 heme exporter protein CcmB [Bacteroidota bacterium]MDP4243015.1 heme exporter protein CcmB [Bacteroidota bacterium]MDP4287441.1 heme exporter protein CcmB [Bacteroidota bacterium]